MRSALESRVIFFSITAREGANALFAYLSALSSAPCRVSSLDRAECCSTASGSADRAAAAVVSPAGQDDRRQLAVPGTAAVDTGIGFELAPGVVPAVAAGRSAVGSAENGN